MSSSAHRPYRLIAVALLTMIGATGFRIGASIGARRVSAFRVVRPRRSSPLRQVQYRLFSTNSGEETESPQNLPEPMSNLYTEWSVEQDRLLYENRHKSPATLASLLGRGLKGVETRLEKLKDVDSTAYDRLFAGGKLDNHEDGSAGMKLVPSREVLRRIQYDAALPLSDFTVLHYDRVDDKIVESPMDAPNTSIAGSEMQLVLALPEHRIVGIKYKQRIVWDREKRIDRVFGSGAGSGETIDMVIASYDKWKREKDAAEEWNRQQQAALSNRIRQILGIDRFDELKDKSSNLQESFSEADGLLQKKEIEAYVQGALRLFQDARQDPSSSLEPSLIPMTDIDALYAFSELAAMLPNSELRQSILTEVSRVLNGLEGKKAPSLDVYQLPELNEDDLEESFVRGAGAGGQKVNKTSNRVVLVHLPTSLRVECQDTRSLQQNRKIARKRLRLKLDEYLNGADSKASRQTKKAVTKKQKAKARSRARQRKKKEESA